MHARPSFGMTPTQAIKNLFAWCDPYNSIELDQTSLEPRAK